MMLSYIVDIPLGKWSSEENGDMDLALSRGERKLSTANAIYSFGKHYRSFAYAFDHLRLREDISIETVLVLGWGLGSIAELLNGHPGIRRVVGIEHDPTLVDLCEKMNETYSFEVEIIRSDAIQYAMNTKAAFDLVCSDIFVDDKTPAAVISVEYLRTISQLTQTGGRVLLSKLNLTLADKRQNQVLESTLKQEQMPFEVLNTIGNRMYYWPKQ